MALSLINKADIRKFLGWSARFHQSDSRLEQAMSAVDTEPEHEAQITNSLTGTPPGILASLEDLDAKLTDAHKRLKALKVGSIGLAGYGEIKSLRNEGRRHVGRLASILGVEVRQDVFSSSGPATFGGFFGMIQGGSYGLHG